MSVNGPIVTKEIKEKVIANMWNYVYENFHKFTDNNKIRIVLGIISKDMPTKVEGDLGGGTKVIIVKEKDATSNRISAVPAEVPSQ